jgi:hypothetical protein
VDGKSPVDYLDERQQGIVRCFVLELGLAPSDRMLEAIGALRERVQH